MSHLSSLAALEPCVHCGLCLQACPTYRATGDEADGPRGRIVLMQGVLKGELRQDDPNVASHLDSCLGCRACETACPSGVEYGIALENVRADVRLHRPHPLPIRLLLSVLANPAIGKPFFSLSRLIRRLIPSTNLLSGIAAADLLRGTRPRGLAPTIRIPPEARAQPLRRKKVALFTGCVMDGLFSHVHDATRRVLRANGYQLVEVGEQVCCGALHAHYGDREEARQLASANLTAFKDYACQVVVNSAGCGAALKEYRHLVGEKAGSFSSRVVDITEVLCQHEIRTGASLPLKVAYDPPCHLEHAQRITESPRQILEGIPGLEVVQAPDSDQCCGSAGIYSLVQKEMGKALLNSKTTSLTALDPDIVATGNPGCIMQISAGLARTPKPIPVVHPIELLDWSYAKAGFYDGVL